MECDRIRLVVGLVAESSSSWGSATICRSPLLMTWCTSTDSTLGMARTVEGSSPAPALAHLLAAAGLLGLLCSPATRPVVRSPESESVLDALPGLRRCAGFFGQLWGSPPAKSTTFWLGLV